MKEKIAAVLVDIVSVVDILIIRLRNRRKISQDNRLILVRLDAIGDFVMWLDAAKAFREEGFDKIILICNQVCRDIAVNTCYFDEVIGVDYGKLRRTSRIKYRWSIHRLLKHIEGKRAVQCTYSKEIFSDVVMSAITAEEKITVDSPQITTARWTYRFTKIIYQKIIQTPQEFISEIKRNAIFTGHVLGKEIKSGVPILKDVENAQKKVPKEDYYLLFLGASEPERMWPVERFAKIAERLFCDERYAKLKCCIGGSKQERYLYEQFCQEYRRNNVIDKVGKTTLPELIEIIRKAEFIITNDTSAVHFAAAVDTPAICLWGPWEYGRFLPYDVEQKDHRKLPIVCYHEMDCRNCLLQGTHKTRECEQFILKHGIRKCLDQVAVEDVMQKLKFL